MALAVEANSPLAEQLTLIVQPKLVDMGWTTGGFDDSALTEYIILMLVNGKTQEQIATELSNDLLNLGPEDAGANIFAGWLFEQVNQLAGHANGDAQPSSEAVQAQIGSAVTPALGAEGTEQAGEAASGDAEMGDVMDGVQGNMWVKLLSHPSPIANMSRSPTGPKSMRGTPTGPRNSARRILGQVNRAMDRSSDPMHRVRAQSGERISMHNRQPPRGPRGNLSQPGPLRNGIPTGPAKLGPQGRGAGPMNGPMGGPMNGPMNPEAILRQQQQLMQMMQQMVASGAAAFQQPGVAPAINPNFQNGGRGKSLFERVESRPNRGRPPFQNRNQGPPKPAPDVDEAGDSTMDVEPGSADGDTKETPSADTVCKFNLKCTKADCPFAHQSPAAPPGTTVDATDTCAFGAACQNRKCTARHPSPAQRKMHQSEQDCKFFPHCTNPHCPFRHPSMPLCRNGADCTREGCRFTHVRTACKFNPCLNPACAYKHEEGQKRGKFGDMVWRAPGGAGGAAEGEDGGKESHLSERKFVADGDGPEELVTGGGQAEGGPAGTHSSQDVDITVS